MGTKTEIRTKRLFTAFLIALVACAAFVGLGARQAEAAPVVEETSFIIDGQELYVEEYYKFQLPISKFEDNELMHRLRVTGLEPNSSYKLSSQFIEMLTDGREQTGYGDWVGEEISLDLQSDADGVIEIEYSFGKLTNLRYDVYYRLFCDLTPVGQYWPVARVTGEYFHVFKDAKDETVRPVQVDVAFAKVDENGKPLSGAALELVNEATGQVVSSWTSTSDAQELSLEVGSYTLRETKAPEGYKTAADHTYTFVDDDADVHGYNYSGYSIFTQTADESDRSEIHLTKADGSFDPDKDPWGYCINLGKEDPALVDWHNWEYLIYTEHLMDDETLSSRIANHDEPIAGISHSVTEVIYAGYPTNGIGLQEKYGVSDAEFSGVTQNAIHHFTDEKTYEESDFDSPVLYQLYQEMLNLDIEVPDNMVLKIYIPSNDLYQSIISAEFSKKATVEIKFANEPLAEEEDEPKEDEPKDEEKPKSSDEEGSDDTGTTGPEDGDAAEETAAKELPDTADPLAKSIYLLLLGLIGLLAPAARLARAKK